MAELWVTCDLESSRVSARPCVSLLTGGVMHPGKRYGPSQQTVKLARAEIQWQRDRLAFWEWVSG